ncbi:MAG TPA: FMN-binding protein [Candidatus Paceibacterota bacterium]|nr:FMN-binding protein [Candidatus Paceibacterota bacterium]
MKRYLISAGLVFTSIAYLVAQHFGAEDDHVVTPPISDATTGTSSGTTPTYSHGATGNSSGATSGTNSTSSDTANSGSTGTTGTTGTGTTGQYADGSYTGTAANAYYGYVQVKAVISGGKLTAVDILQYPNDRSTSRYINSQALPYLEQEAIAAQSANINTISGASDTSAAFKESLSAALAQAHA